MSKPLSSKIWLLLIFLSTTALAQQKRQVFDKYVTNHTSFSPVNFFIEDRFLVANPRPDSLNIRIDTIADLQKIINKQLENKVYAVEIQNTRKQDLAGIFALLVGFKNLTFLKLDDPFFPNPKDRPYQLPESIKALQQLKAIEFSSTDKLDLDDAFDKLKELKQLNTLALSGYNHPVLLSLGKLPGIKHIRLASINLQGVDLNKFGWETLQLSGSLPNAGPDAEVLSKIPDIKTLSNLALEFYSLGDGAPLPLLKQLTTLSFNNCVLAPPVKLFAKIAPLKRLTNLSLMLWSDSTQTINGIEALVNLQYLRFIIPSLEKHPEQLSSLRGLKNVQSLNIVSSKLIRLPDVFSGLTQLKKLRVDGNQLEQLPASIFNLPQLEYLNASSNKLRQQPVINSYKCKNLKTLNLSYNALTTLPAAITTLTNLEQLDARGNKLAIVNGEWQGMLKLKEVNFENNVLTKFPAQLQLVSSLEKLDVSSNEITFIPDITIARVYNLKSLNVSGNQLTALPEHIGRYTKLEELQAEGNRLTSVPESLGDCRNIKLLNFRTANRRMHFDADKIDNARFAITAPDSSKVSNIKTLPARLKDAPDLTSINLEGNPDINSNEVFNILLAKPRKNLRVNLRNTGITELPNDPRWSDLTFFQLDLSNNKMQTLPPEFAKVNTIYEISLYKNPLKVDAGVFNGTLTSRADIKVLYDELHIDVPENIISNTEYAIALTKHIRDFHNAGRWDKGIEYAKKAIIADPNAYAETVNWDYIGTCRFKVNDYAGAIKDFEQYLIKTERNFIRVINFIDPVIRYKAQAHIALGQVMEAAKTYEYYYTNYRRGLAQAAVFYKAAGNDALFKSMLDIALRDALNTLDANKKARPNITDDSVLDYAELLLIANRPTDAAEALANYMPSTKPRQTIKSYLLATASYLKDDKQFDTLKTSLVGVVSTSGKISSWDFDLFNTWLQNSGMTKLRQDQLLELQNIAK